MRFTPNKLYLKLGLIGIMALLLLIPTAMIQELVAEREQVQQKAISEVTDKWGREQFITGPILRIPFQRKISTKTNDSPREMHEYTEFLYILPEELRVSASLEPEKRNRGIHEIVVYETKLQFQGKFDQLLAGAEGEPVESLQWEKAELIVGIPDLRGLEYQNGIRWNNTSLAFEPGLQKSALAESGLRARLNLKPTNDSSFTFDFSLRLKGSQKLAFSPVGKLTDVRMTSSWPHPSFTGAFLPDSSNISNDGFTAHWNVLQLNRNFPQRWTGDEYQPAEAAFGVELFLPADQYQKTHRSIRYALLFIGLSFLVFFFHEMIAKMRLHPIHYLLVGIALVVFYTLLLSLSEQIGFNTAFALSALATLVLISSYVAAILQSTRFGVKIGGILSILYAFIFVVLQSDDYALLMGSLGLFMVLAGVMYFSRKIDWYTKEEGS
jgi:inner membrane protein